MKVEEFEKISDFQRGFLLLAEACKMKFEGDIRRIAIFPDRNQVEIEFT